MDYPDPRIAALRRFNRFYTQKIGVLAGGLHPSPFSLTETRILNELAHRPDPSAADLARELGLDGGYLSRVLLGFEKSGLIAREAAPDDGRKSVLRLTDNGKIAVGLLETQSSAQAAEMLAGLPTASHRRLVRAMRDIEATLGGTPSRAWVMRPLRPGDLGWVIASHGAIYHREFGWDGSFETLVAEIAASIAKNFNPLCEAGWIAELDGMPIGSVFLIRVSDEVAKLRLLIVDPAARGLGIGVRLVAECTNFARAAGYRRITLWTQSILLAARRIYAEEGYRLVGSEALHDFGQDLISETWELALD